jgi:hypothetical protein
VFVRITFFINHFFGGPLMDKRQPTGHTATAETINFREIEPDKQTTASKDEARKFTMSHYIIATLIGFVTVLGYHAVKPEEAQSPVVVTVTVPVPPPEESVGDTAQPTVVQLERGAAPQRIIPATELVQMLTSQEAEQEDRSPEGQQPVTAYSCSGKKAKQLVREDGGFAKC